MKHLINLSLCLSIFYGIFYGCKNDNFKNGKIKPNPLAHVHSNPVEKSKTIFLQPYGNISSEFIDVAVNGIKAMFKMEVQVLPAIDLPKIALSTLRNRYKSDVLLLDLVKRKGDCFKIIGLTEKDICIPDHGIPDWGILGYGSIDGYSCVVSTFRMKRNVTKVQIHERLVKVINHEIGHTLNLDHCEEKYCLMEDAHGTIQTVDAEDGSFCAACSEKIAKYLVKRF